MNSSIEFSQDSINQEKFPDGGDGYCDIDQPSDQNEPNPNGLPSIPRILFLTNFLSPLTWEEIKDRIRTFLNSQKCISFDPAQEAHFKWVCSYVNGSAHGVYQIKAYWNNIEKKHVIEVHRLEGDGIYFCELFGSLRELLSDRIPKNKRVNSKFCVVEDVAELKSCGDVQHSMKGSRCFDMDTLITPLIEMLTSPFREIQLEGAKLACDVTTRDVAEKTMIIPPLINIFKSSNNYEKEKKKKSVKWDNSEIFDWAGQHAIVALVNMSESIEASNIICADKEFIQLILSHATKDGSIYNIQMKRKCAEILINLIISQKEDLVKIDDVTLKCWLVSNDAEFLLSKEEEGTKKLQDAISIFNIIHKNKV